VSASLPAFRKWSFGHGSRQWAGSSGSHPRGAAVAGPGVPATARASAARQIPFPLLVKATAA
jgi:hypothetical protein